jgi:hypothetical protein
VAGLAHVSEFVDDEVVEQGDGELHGGPVDVEVVVLAERAPPVAKIADVEMDRYADRLDNAAALAGPAR